MRISVVIPTYNRAELLQESLESVFAQTYKPSQVIVVDDGSTDHTDKVLAEFGDQVQTIRLGQSGVSAARNAGIDVATGDYIAFLDSDDLWHPEKIEKHLAFATTHPEMKLTYTDALQFSRNGIEEKSFAEIFPALKNPSHLFTPMISEFAIPLTSTVMIQTSLLKKTELRFPVKIKIGEDLGLFLKILLAGEEFGYLPEKLTMRRMHESNISGNHCRRFEQRKLLYTDLLRQSPHGCTPKQTSALKFGLRDARYRVGECLWKEFNLSKARSEFFHAISLDANGMRSIAYGLLTLLPVKSIQILRTMKESK